MFALNLLAADGFASAPSGDLARTRAIERLRAELDTCDAVLVGAGSGLSAAAGFTYSGERFERAFPDFIAKYGFKDMYSAGFYPFPTPGERWAFWSRYVDLNRYACGVGAAYRDLLALLEEAPGRDYFVLTTNVDHQFQRAGFDKGRLFYTQGDYGLFQCAEPCCRQTFDNEEAIRTMVEGQRAMSVPDELITRCPVCGGEIAMNLRCDDTFVEDEGWHRAAARYEDFLRRHRGMRVLLLDLGTGWNTPGIVKIPFWQMCAQNPQAAYACVNLGEAICPHAIEDRAILIDADIAAVLRELRG